MHGPVYPAANSSITYTLDARSTRGIHEVELYETVTTLDSAGTVTATSAEVLLEEWSFPAEPPTVSVSHVKSSGYPANRLITYRYRIRSGRWYGVSRASQDRNVTFAIRPYPAVNQPAPVYVQGDVDHVFDVVFIPDTDITNMQTFRQNCASMISDAIFAEPSIQIWNTQFNFYINPLTGTATDYDRISTDGTHQTPTNWSNLSFAEAKVLMHQNNLRDYAMGDLFSTEQQNRGTMMHEGGHSLFGLADEYAGGVHWEADDYPNNWDELADAQSDAPDRGKTSADAVEMGTSGWHKLCVNACPMKTSGLVRNDYDEPCTDRVVFSILENATD
jgi:hypothetical protein